MQSNVFHLKDRLWAGGWHLLASLLVATIVALLVFGLWFPGPYRYLAGGTELLLLIMGVDVVLGPMLTFAVFNPRKGKRHLTRDIATIAVIQIAALCYGLSTVYLARPVALIFEYDRFRVISAADVVDSELEQALPEYRYLPLNGPKVIAVRKTQQGTERNEALAAAVFDGVDTSQRPRFWIPYGNAEKVLAHKASRPIRLLLDRFPDEQQQIRQALSETGATEADAQFLPVRARKDAVAIIRADGSIAGFLSYDGFF